MTASQFTRPAPSLTPTQHSTCKAERKLLEGVDVELVRQKLLGAEQAYKEMKAKVENVSMDGCDSFGVDVASSFLIAV